MFKRKNHDKIENDHLFRLSLTLVLCRGGQAAPNQKGVFSRSPVHLEDFSSQAQTTGQGIRKIQGLYRILAETGADGIRGSVPAMGN